MTPETNKVSKCCGDRLISETDIEGTGFYVCFACNKPCDGVQDCADCFPQHWKEEKGTVPLCEKHAKGYYPKQPCDHCWLTGEGAKGFGDHSDCEHCCKCNVSYIDANKDVSFRCKLCGDKFSTSEKAKNCNHDYLIAKEVLKTSASSKPKNDDYASLIGGLILNVGNLYNENKQDITVRVAEYIYKNYIK